LKTYNKSELTAWYYEYHDKNSFPHQKMLCEAVAWTKYNLEGQIALSTSLSASHGNPLTLRLLAMKNALDQMKNHIGELDNKITATAAKQLSNKKFFGFSGSYHGQNDILTGNGAPIEIIEFEDDGIKYRYEIKWLIIHLALYEFYSNLGSVLDRLAYEINNIYELKANKIDWAKLMGFGRDERKYLDDLHTKDVGLEKYLKDNIHRFDQALKYRNRIVHDGIIECDIVTSHNGVQIYLSNEPDSNNRIIGTNALDFCKETKVHVLQLLDTSYDLMFQYFKSNISQSDKRLELK